MDGRDEAGGAERALTRLNENPVNASVKLVMPNAARLVLITAPLTLATA